MIGVHITHPDFSTRINLITSIGEFSEKDYLTEMNITTNKDVKNKVVTYIGYLMYFPVAISIFKGEIDKLIPGTNVFVEDDMGEIRKGILSRIVTNGRPIKDDDKIRLNCTKDVEFKLEKLCELEFLGVGDISKFSVPVDASGTPDRNLLIYK